MSSLLISVLVSLGASTWIFNQLQNRNGRNTQQSLIASAVAALVMFVLLISILGLMF